MENNMKPQENNNKLKDAAKDATRAATKQAKNIIKKGVLTLISSIAPLLFQVGTIAIIGIILISAIEYIVQQKSTANLASNVYEAMEVDDFSELVEIKKDSDGEGYHFEFVSDFDERMKKAVNAFNHTITKNVTLEDEELLKKIVQADISTKFPELVGESEGTKKFQGSIKVKRKSPDKNIGEMKECATTVEKKLKYVSRDTFDSYVSNGDLKALDVYTLTDDMKEIITTTWSYDGNNNISENSNIIYRDLTQQYSMPFEYLLDFLVNTNNNEFVSGLADLAINSAIECTVIDSVTTEQVDSTTKVYTDESGQNIEVAGSTTESTIISENVTTNVEITNVDGWWIKKTVDLDLASSRSVSHGGDASNIIVLDDGTHQTTVITTENTTINNNIDIGETQKESNEKKFVDLYTIHKTDLNQIIQPNWIFVMLENNEKTSNMVELTKYLLYKANGKDYGFTSFEDLDVFNMVDMDSSGGLGDYIVKTDMSGAMPKLTKEELIKAINSCYSGNTKTNLINNVDSFMYIQEHNKVNAAFGVAVTIVESSGGTNWSAIDSSTYNWMSVTGRYNGNSYKNPNSSNTRTWCSYPSFEEATKDFGDLISNKNYYFNKGRYTVGDIAFSYCNAGWGDSVCSELDKIYQAAGVALNISDGETNGSAIVQKAEEIMQKMMNEKYVYVQGNKVPMSANGKQCDCSTFVCWVLYELGYTNAQNNGSQLSTFTMDTNGSGYFKNNGWTKINSYDNLEPGDIVIMSGGGTANGHVEIFAYKKDGRNYYINCGWSPSEHTSVYETYQTDFYSAWRVPSSGSSSSSSSSSSAFWWPVGGNSTTKEKNVLFAKGAPTSTDVWNGWGYSSTYHTDFHKGIDIGNAGNSKNYIIAVTDGKVVHTSNRFNLGNQEYDGSYLDGYGNSVMIKHGNRYVIYGHMRANTVKVKQGDNVKQGQVIGEMGDSGSASGVHICFVILKSETISPDNTINPLTVINASKPRP